MLRLHAVFLCLLLSERCYQTQYLTRHIHKCFAQNPLVHAVWSKITLQGLKKINPGFLANGTNGAVSIK